MLLFFVMKTEGVPSSSSDRFSHPSLGSRSARSAAAAASDRGLQRQSENEQPANRMPPTRGAASKKASTSSTGTATAMAEGGRDSSSGGAGGANRNSARPSRSSEETTTGSSSETETDAERYFAQFSIFSSQAEKPFLIVEKEKKNIRHLKNKDNDVVHVVLKIYTFITFFRLFRKLVFLLFFFFFETSHFLKWHCIVVVEISFLLRPDEITLTVEALQSFYSAGK